MLESEIKSLDSESDFLNRNRVHPFSLLDSNNIGRDSFDYYFEKDDFFSNYSCCVTTDDES